MRLAWLGCLLAIVGCSDDGWKPYTAERDYLECQFQLACAESIEGLDCDAYIEQYEPRANPCERFDVFYAEACIQQMEELVVDVTADRLSCPAESTRGAPACTQAFVVSEGGACSQGQ